MMRKRALGELEPFLDFAVVESWKLFQLFARGWVDRRDGHIQNVAAVYDRRILFFFTEGRRPEKCDAQRAPLQPKAFRNQNAIQQVEAPLHQQCEQRRWDGALQDCGVIV